MCSNSRYEGEEFYCIGKLVLGKLVLGKLMLGKLVLGKLLLGKLCWGNDLTPIILHKRNIQGLRHGLQSEFIAKIEFLVLNKNL